MTQDPNSYSGGGVVPYTVEQALQLLRQLPLEGMNEVLVVQVMRTTLESAGVSIQQLLQMAVQRQDQITNEIVRLQGEITHLNQQIEEKSGQVSMLQEQLGEIDSLMGYIEK